MNSILAGLDVVIALLRTVLFAGGVVVALFAAASYGARTRRISPFGSVGRFVRGTIDPMFAPVERRVVRAGGRPATAPWWGLGAVVIGGIVLVSLLGFLRQQIAMAAFAADAGPRGLVALLVAWTFGLLQIALMVRVFSSWFQLAPHSPWVRWAFALTDWILRPLRQIIPPFGMMDVTPIIAYFLLSLLQRFVVGML